MAAIPIQKNAPVENARTICLETAVESALVHRIKIGKIGRTALREPHSGCDAEVCQLQNAAVWIFCLQQKILGLHVVVYDAHGVAVGQGIQHLVGEDLRRALGEMTRISNTLEKVPTMTKLHQQKHSLTILVDLVEPDDVRMIQLPHHLDLFVQCAGVVVTLMQQLASVVLAAGFVLYNENCTVTSFAYHMVHLVVLVRLR
mmetsp:Transcript_81574/g.170633  ORF Transcript_81574/g.170633 Transcript_81574/m.170633 type:complete len:201 (+) Transcript_81574:1674-2276(+)